MRRNAVGRCRYSRYLTCAARSRNTSTVLRKEMPRPSAVRMARIASSSSTWPQPSALPSSQNGSLMAQPPRPIVLTLIADLASSLSNAVLIDLPPFRCSTPVPGFECDLSCHSSRSGYCGESSSTNLTSSKSCSRRLMPMVMAWTTPSWKTYWMAARAFPTSCPQPRTFMP